MYSPLVSSDSRTRAPRAPAGSISDVSVPIVPRRDETEAERELGQHAQTLDPSVLGEMLVALGTQASAIALVLQAERCGAVQLPRSLRAALERAQDALPACGFGTV